jgi:ligand-binding sensor domain-containing protein
VALLAAGGSRYLVAERAVYELAGRQLVCRYRSPNLIRCALATDSALFLGTAAGALSVNRRRWVAHPLALPTEAAAAPVVTLVRGDAGELWAGVAGFGAYRGRPGAFELVLRVPGISSAVATPDSAVWLGTNLGLHRYHRGRWTRYNEEGVANFEIPDNLVENLLPDHAGTTWVVMSDAVCALPAGPRPLELPTATYLGQPGSELLAAAYLPGAGRLFATSLGLLLLPAASASEFGSFEPASGTDVVAAKPLLRPLGLPGIANPPRLVQLDGRQRLWLADAQGLLVLTARQWRRAAAASAGPLAVARP